MRLTDKVAVVTGGAMGLGKAYALRLALEGADVCVADINLDGAENTAAVIRENGRRAIALKTDVTSETDATALARVTFETFKKIDILVNNAGIVRNVPRGPIEDLKLSDWNRILSVNLTSVFLITKAVVLI